MQSVVVQSGHSSMGELQPSKLAVRVRFPLPAPSWIATQDYTDRAFTSRLRTSSTTER